MRMRGDIDLHYLKNLLQSINKKMIHYLNENAHWWGYSDPDHLKPKNCLNRVGKVAQEVAELESEFNEHFSDILKWSRIIQKKVAAVNDEALKKYIEGLHKKNDHLARLTEDSAANKKEKIVYVGDILSLAQELEALEEISKFTDKIKKEFSEIEYKNKKFFELYYLLLQILHEYSSNQEIKKLLIEELKTQEEAEWDFNSKDENTCIESAFIKLDEAVLFDSKEHQQFCKKWDVTGSLEDYPFWLEMVVSNQIKQDLDEGNYHKIPTLVGMKFGVIALSDQEEKQKGWSPAEKQRLKTEISIWTYSNIIKYFTSYMVQFAISNPDADIDAKGLRIKIDVLDPLLVNIEKARSLEYLGLKVKDEKAEIIRLQNVFYNPSNGLSEKKGNVQQIIMHKDLLTAGYTTDISGYICFKKPSSQCNSPSTFATLHEKFDKEIKKMVGMGVANQCSFAASPSIEFESNRHKENPNDGYSQTINAFENKVEPAQSRINLKGLR